MSDAIPPTPGVYVARQRVEFVDVDSAGIMHFSAYFRGMERTEHAFFRSLAGSVMQPTEAGWHTWPRLRVDCCYLAPLRFEDEFEVRLLVAQRHVKKLELLFVFEREGQPVALGEFLTIHVLKPRDGGAMRSLPIPPELADKLTPAPAEMIAAARALRKG